MTDVAVIGAGIAGSIAAIRLAEEGLEVLLIERRPAPPVSHVALPRGLKPLKAVYGPHVLLPPAIDILAEVGALQYLPSPGDLNIGGGFAMHVSKPTLLAALRRRLEDFNGVVLEYPEVVDSLDVSADGTVLRLSTSDDLTRRIVIVAGGSWVSPGLYPAPDLSFRYPASLLAATYWYSVTAERFRAAFADDIDGEFGPRTEGRNFAINVFCADQNLVSVTLTTMPSGRLFRPRSYASFARFVSSQGLGGFVDDHEPLVGPVITRRVENKLRSATLGGGTVLMVGDALATSNPMHGRGVSLAAMTARSAVEAVVSGNHASYDRFVDSDVRPWILEAACRDHIRMQNWGEGAPVELNTRPGPLGIDSHIGRVAQLVWDAGREGVSSACQRETYRDVLLMRTSPSEVDLGDRDDE